jgi:hypothetical protein
MVYCYRNNHGVIPISNQRQIDYFPTGKIGLRKDTAITNALIFFSVLSCPTLPKGDGPHFAGHGPGLSTTGIVLYCQLCNLEVIAVRRWEEHGVKDVLQVADWSSAITFCSSFLWQEELSFQDRVLT